MVMRRMELARAYSDRAREAQRAGDYRSAAALFGEAITLLSLPFDGETELSSSSEPRGNTEPRAAEPANADAE